MKSDGLQRVLSKLAGVEQAANARAAIEALASAPPHTSDEAAYAPRGLPDGVAENRPGLPPQATDFNPGTGLPQVAMDRFPLPCDDAEGEVSDADIFA